MAKKTIVHFLYGPTKAAVCGLTKRGVFAYAATSFWAKVTCKNCLKYKDRLEDHASTR